MGTEFFSKEKLTGEVMQMNICGIVEKKWRLGRDLQRDFFKPEIFVDASRANQPDVKSLVEGNNSCRIVRQNPRVQKVSLLLDIYITVHQFPFDRHEQKISNQQNTWTEGRSVRNTILEACATVKRLVSSVLTTRLFQRWQWSEISG